ncbi:MAG: hypothetical protein K5799_05115 [Erythrobacter sp.]|nr:hypothetical protein [Erythrobacter sp.]
MTDTFTVCALRTRPVDASIEDSDLHVFAAGATRFTFENGRWTSASSSWIGGGGCDPDADALQWIAEQLETQPLVTWSMREFVEQARRLALQADMSCSVDVVDLLKVIRDAVRRSAIPSLEVRLRDADGLEGALDGDMDTAEMVVAMHCDAFSDPLAMHRAIIAETQLIGRLTLQAVGRGAELVSN